MVQNMTHFFLTCSNLVPKALAQQALSHCCLKRYFEFSCLACAFKFFSIMYFLATIIFPASSNLTFICYLFSCTTCTNVIITFLESVNGIEADGSSYVIQADETIHYALNKQLKYQIGIVFLNNMECGCCSIEVKRIYKYLELGAEPSCNGASYTGQEPPCTPCKKTALPSESEANPNN